MNDKDKLATHAGAAAERVTTAMVEQLAAATAEAEAIDGNLKAIRSRVDALTSTPAEPDAYNRRLRAQLEQEWADLQRLKNAYTPAETPPAAGAIDARGQEASTNLPKGNLSKVWRAADDVCEWLNYEVWPEKSPGLKKSVDILNEEMMRAEIRASRAASLKEEKCRTCNDNGMIGGPSFYDPGEGGVPCPDCASRPEAPAAAGAAQAVAELTARATKMATSKWTAPGISVASLQAMLKELLSALAATPAPAAGIHTLSEVVRLLRKHGHYEDEEGEATNHLDDLLQALKAVQPVEREDGE